MPRLEPTIQKDVLDDFDVVRRAPKNGSETIRNLSGFSDLLDGVLYPTLGDSNDVVAIVRVLTMLCRCIFIESIS